MSQPSASNLFHTTQPSSLPQLNDKSTPPPPLQPRIGTIFPGQTRQLKTPNYIIGTVRGNTPHLTPDLVQTLPQYNSMQVSLGEVHTLIPALEQYKITTKSDKPYHDMIVLPKNHCIAVGLRNPTTDLMYFNKRYNPSPNQIELDAQFPYQLSSKIAATRSETGAIRLTPKDFLKKSKIFSPDFLLLGGQDSDIFETKSRAEKTMRRNLEWLDQLYINLASGNDIDDKNNNDQKKDEKVKKTMNDTKTVQKDHQDQHQSLKNRIYRTYADIISDQQQHQQNQDPSIGSVGVSEDSELSLTRPFLIAPLEGGSHMDKRTRNGGVISRKGTPSWIHIEPPNRHNYQNNEDFIKDEKIYQDKITNEGFDVKVISDGYHIGGLGTSINSEQRREMINASMMYIIGNDVNANIPSRLRMTTITGEPAELVDMVANGIDIVSVTYPQILTEEGLAMNIPIKIEKLQEIVKKLRSSQQQNFENSEEKIIERVENFDQGKNGIEILTDNDKLHEYNIMNLRDERFIEDNLPIDPECICYACKHHSRSYINHLLNTHEMLAEVLLILHNLHQYSQLFQNMRDLIEIDTINKENNNKDEKNENENFISQFEKWARLTKEIYVPHSELLHRNARNRNYVHHDPSKGSSMTPDETQ